MSASEHPSLDGPPALLCFDSVHTRRRHRANCYGIQSRYLPWNGSIKLSCWLRETRPIFGNPCVQDFNISGNLTFST